MNFFATLKMIFRTLLARKGRSFLTILGIFIGVAGVIIIISMGAGAQSLVLGQVNKLGSNLLSIQPGKSSDNGPPAQLYGIVVTTLTNSDAQALRDTSRVPHALAVDPVVRGSATITWGNKEVDTSFTGTDSSYGSVTNFTMSDGDFFDAKTDQENAVVLGSTVSDELFKDAGVDPVGQIIKVSTPSSATSGVLLRVLGVIASRGTVFFQDQDDQIFMPLTIGQHQLLGINYLQSINIKVDDSANIQSTIDDVTAVLDQTHHIRSDTDVDFTVRNEAQAVSILTTITSALSLFLTAMAAISLVVGGIGILNIMLVTVAERTREIGLRKAVGATNKAVLTQFLFEASTLTSLGGVIGIIFGIIVSYLVSLLMHILGYDWAFVISLTSIIAAITVSIATGVIFGLYPAFKASKLDPIEALRYE